MSRQAIAKSITSNFKASNSTALRKALKSGVSKGQLVQDKGSYRLAAGVRKAKKKPKKKKKKKKKKAKGASPPAYGVMVVKTLTDLRGFMKMSRQAIAKSITSNFKASNSTALRKALKSG